MPLRELLTPRQVAIAIGVSESSLKRWCDQGLLTTERTAGGHRRLPLASVLKFLQKSGHTLASPELLGLPSMLSATQRSLENAVIPLRDALLAGQELVCRRLALDLYLAGHRWSAICDQTVRPALESIGTMWECGLVHIFQERAACEVVQRLLTEMRLVWSNNSSDAPLAIGCSLSGDYYRLPTAMVELVLLECGWRACSLGNGLPLSAVTIALEQQRPRLVWLCVSYLPNEAELLAEYPRFYATSQALGTAVVLGGLGLTATLLAKLQFTLYGADLQSLETYAKTVFAQPDENDTATRTARDDSTMN